MLLEGVAAVVLIITVYDGTTTARIMIITILDIRIKFVNTSERSLRHFVLVQQYSQQPH